MILPFNPAVYFLSSLCRTPKGEDLPVAKYFPYRIYFRSFNKRMII
jgi:hypothetical protein